jgi:hypothetical protein
VLTHACSPALFEFARNHTLHDGLVVQFRLSVKDCSAVLQVQGWNPKFDERRLYTLLYRGVEAFEERGPPDSYHSRHETTDISYFEFHPSGNGAFEHRILFHSDVEFSLIFKAFEFSYEVTPLRRAG